MCVVQGGESDDKEGSGVLPSINQMRKGPLGVPIAPQTLGESEPRRKTLDDRPNTIGVGVTHAF